ncbi:uncharacterized protein COLE_06903 [Cutaneotrichosporon oleaginosum]|nr:hypothetical protein COLE_06903 [Cutaneotrichosporon oleaginosum]
MQSHQQQYLPAVPAPPGHGGPQGNNAPWGGPFPSLHLWPIQDTFQMKMIHLPGGQRVKIGRQTNTKTVPGERNAYFDSKVLSRTHAEIWEQGGKIFIKDLKSSNGTFINGVRLSPEGVESDPYQLNTEDLVEFGIDIISEDNRTIIHHKVSARAYCVMGPEDAAVSARELPHYQNDMRNARRGGSVSQPNTVNPLSHMGPSIMSAGGKANGLSFEHVLQKLQNELAKSKETGQELQVLAGSMSEVQDTLGGGLPPNQNGVAGQYIPAQFRNPSAEAQAALAGPHGSSAAAFIALQSQMNDTQSSVATHLERIRQLEGQIQHQDALQLEIASVRKQMDDSRREMEQLLAASRASQNGSHYDDDDDDDARSVATVTPDDDVEEHRASRPNGSASKGQDDLASRIQALTTEMSDALQLSKTLQAQHGEAMAAVKQLTQRVGILESDIADRVSAATVQAEERWAAWRSQFEEKWKKERESWESERERLRGVVREWEEASRRAVEEEEEREMNEQLSGDELVDEEDEDVQQDVEEGELLAVHNRWQSPRSPTTDSLNLDEVAPSLAKPRRRRPSTKTALAMRSLRAVANNSGGASTPKGGAETPPATKKGRREPSSDALRRVKGGRGRSNSRPASPNVLNEKESSESGRESADTLRGEKENVDRRLENGFQKPTALQVSHPSKSACADPTRPSYPL